MSFDNFVTSSLVPSVLSTESVRSVFKTIAAKQIVDSSSLKERDSEALTMLEEADLIGSGAGGAKYYVTAKGLKVARDIEQL